MALGKNRMVSVLGYGLYATNIYVNNHYNIELVRVLLQHSSSVVTQRHIGIGSKELEDATQKNVCLG